MICLGGKEYMCACGNDDGVSIERMVCRLAKGMPWERKLPWRDHLLKSTEVAVRIQLVMLRLRRRADCLTNCR